MALRRKNGRKKAGNLVADFLLGVPPLRRRLFSCKWERLLVQPELKQRFQKRFRDVVLCVPVCLPAYPGGVPYVAPVMLQHKVDRFRLAAGRLYDCFIGRSLLFLMCHSLHFLVKPPYGSADMVARCAAAALVASGDFMLRHTL